MAKVKCTRPTDAERFWQKARRSDGCWQWAGAIRPGGHGVAFFRGKLEGAHRVAWILTHGAIPAGMFICHNCDNPSCVNPSHLFIGTHADNMRDMRTKGRGRGGPRKLTASDVAAVGVLLRDGIGQRLVAERFGVSRSAIALIAQGHNWKSVP